MNKDSNDKKTDLQVSSENSSDQDEIQLIQQFHRFSGPIPAPDTLKQYKDIYPESVKIIMDMAVKQAEHRQYMEKENISLERDILKADNRQSNAGRISAVFIITLILGVIVFAIIKGESTIGSILAGALISISGIFALGKRYIQDLQKTIKKDKK
jgi:uncharacterized membrane protein